MKAEKFTIRYLDQTLHVEQANDINDQIFYKVSFADGKKIELYATPKFDGMSTGWAEGAGEKTDQAREIGELIESREK